MSEILTALDISIVPLYTHYIGLHSYLLFLFIKIKPACNVYYIYDIYICICLRSPNKSVQHDVSKLKLYEQQRSPVPCALYLNFWSWFPQGIVMVKGSSRKLLDKFLSVSSIAANLLHLYLHLDSYTVLILKVVVIYIMAIIFLLIFQGHQ